MPDPRPSLTVVMPVFNGAPWIEIQLAALAAQCDITEAWEVVVADNGSSDGTRDLVRSMIEDFPVPLRLVDASRRRGASHARNAGASAARAPALAYCDCDDVVDTRWAAAALAAIDQHDVVMGINRALLQPHDPEAEVLNPGGLVGRGIQSCNFAIRREVFFDVGGFDESLPPYGCEDSELSIRVLARGYRIEPAHDMVLFFRRTVGFRRTLKKVYMSGIAETLVWQRHPSSFAHELSLRGVLADVARWPVWAASQLAARQISRRRLVRTAVTAWAHVVGYLTWVRVGRARHARLIFEPHDVTQLAP